MKKIRIGNDITVSWEVKTSGEALSLEGRSLRLYVRNAYRRDEITDFSVSGDVVYFVYRANQQKTLGGYCVELVDETEGSNRTVCADLAFTLVSHTSEETDTATDDVADFEAYLVSLKSNILVGRPGMSAYDIWVGLGHTGTEADFLDWIKKSAVDAAADVYKLIPEVQEATTAANMAKVTAEDAATKANAAVESVGTAMSEVDVLKNKASEALADAEASAEKSDAATERANTAAANAENAVTSFFNATTEVPLKDGEYYKLLDTADTTKSAVHVAKAQGKNSGGLFLTFKADASTWKHYQYVGTTTEDDNWYKGSNWTDLADIAPGAEMLVIVDNVCGTLASGYTLTTAAAALKALQTSTGTTYVRHGTVISYTTAEGRMETKQYAGAADDNICDATLWKNFGGARQVVLTQTEYDTMAEAGTLEDDVYYNVLEDE